MRKVFVRVHDIRATKKGLQEIVRAIVVKKNTCKISKDDTQSVAVTDRQSWHLWQSTSFHVIKESILKIERQAKLGREIYPINRQ